MAKRSPANAIGAVGKRGPKAVLRTPHDATSVQPTVRRDAQHELVRNVIDFYAGDLGATIGKVAHNAATGKTSIAIVHRGRRIPWRIPFDANGLSALASPRETSFPALKGANVRTGLIIIRE